MKKVFDTRMVCHVWAQQSQYEGRTSDKNIFFRDKTIYSYGEHFPMARFLDADTVLVNRTHHSPTTGKHQSYVRQAIDHLHSIYTTTEIIKFVNSYQIKSADSKKKLKDLVAGSVTRVIVTQAQRAVKRKRVELKQSDIAIAQYVYKNAVELLNFYKIKMPVAVKHKLDQAKKLKKEAELEIKRREENARTAAKLWVKGEELGYGDLDDLHRSQEIYLRIRNNENEIETTRGATFPVEHARRAFKFILECRKENKEWHTNGHTIHLGHFQIDSIDSEGNVRAGCHQVKWPEIERIATILGEL